MRKTLLLLCLYFKVVLSFAQDDKPKIDANLFLYSISNSGELQYNISDKHEKNPQYVNLIEMGASFAPNKYWKNGAFEVSFWSIADSFGKRSVANDELTFSNIEAGNHWLICSKLGYRHTMRNINLFVGIYNINQDYFANPYSSLFTNSSSGVFPTISMNYNLANYPQGSLGFYAEYNNKRLSVKNSFYSNQSDGEKNVFNFEFDLKQYGYLNISQIQYTGENGIYTVGLVLDKFPNKHVNHSLYALIEQPILKINNRKLGLIGQLGYAPKKYNYCKAYSGVGIIATGLFQTDEKDDLGLIAYRADINGGGETAIELTYRYIVNSFFSIQPAFHYICNDNANANVLVGLLRGTLTFGN